MTEQPTETRRMRRYLLEGPSRAAFVGHIEMHPAAKPLHAAWQGDSIYIWCLEWDEHYREVPKTTRTFAVVDDVQELPACAVRHIGGIQCGDQGFVLHVFEVLS